MVHFDQGAAAGLAGGAISVSALNDRRLYGFTNLRTN
jgi:hypothetical protein